MTSRGASLRSSLRRLKGARDGAVLAWAAVTVPILLGLGALAIDLSRLYSLQTQLQTAADAAALAAAAELDGRPSAITRGDAALANTATNDQIFGSAGRARVTISMHRYLSALPASDATPIGANLNTTNPALARFVEVTVAPVQLNFLLPVIPGLTQTNTSAVAVAGFRSTVCQFTPMFICNPYEGTGTSIFTAATTPSEMRRLFRLRMYGGGNAQYSAGNYGFLDAPIGQGSSAIEDAVAQARPPSCYDQNGVNLRPGNPNSVRDGFNVRFDMYNANLSKKKSDPNYRPARNVVKGYVYNGANACNAAASAQAYGLPRDSCFATNTCTAIGTSGAGRVGAGDWDFVTYLEKNHNKPASVTIAGTTYTINYTTRTFVPASRPSRYQVYRWEIDDNRIPNANGYNQPNTKEKGAPACYSGGGVSDTPDRRLLYVAVLDCQALTAQGLMSGGNSSGALPVTAFARMFLTEPVENGANADIYAEFNGIVEPGKDDGIIHDQVQLYR